MFYLLDEQMLAAVELETNTTPLPDSCTCAQTPPL